MQDIYGFSEVYNTVLIIFCLSFICINIFYMICMWKIFTKAGKLGWTSLIPIYSNYQLFDVAYGDGWKFLLLLIPIVNMVVSIQLLFKLANSFGQGTLFGMGLLFLSWLFIPILAFNKNIKYVGPYSRF